ncbi:porin family protein [Fibrobacter sp. UBA4297]|uniref:porin family protein n=1 Tax=Fibrobacter sp. UBA4297 TaxID=1946536 RepID=UPI0025C5082A|nr:porin family protein [Fibrobacter sp. UBA4297]
MLKNFMLAALVVTSAVFAENSTSNALANVKFGAHAAFNYGTVWGDNTDKFKFEGGPGFTGGFDVKVDVSPTVSIITGLEFEYRSIDWNIGEFYRSMAASQDVYLDRDEESMISGMKFGFSLGYLNIPLMVRFNAHPQIFIDAGIRLGFNVSSEMEVSAYGMSNSIDVPKQMQKDIDFGIVAGAGYSVMPNFDVFFRYTMGFTDMIDVVKIASVTGEEVDYSEAPNVGFKNMRFQIGATFWFN